MNRVAILGPGLLGGSAALALRRTSAVEVALWARRPEALEEAVACNVAHRVSGSLAEVLEGADTVVLCVPVGAMEDMARRMLPHITPGTLVTDVGSVKEPVVRVLAPLLRGHALFVGSHPMAGSEKAGLRHARADLFVGATCIITPETASDSCSDAVVRARSLWELVGGKVALLSPQEHDRVCALISHMPHLLAAVMVNAVQSAAPEAFAFAGPGFRDTTRVAGGLPDMWKEILCANRQAVLEALESFGNRLEEVQSVLRRSDSDSQAALLAFLGAAKARRDTLNAG